MSADAILVTGAGGFVCSEVVLALARAGRDVIATDRAFDAATTSRLAGIRRIEAPFETAMGLLGELRPQAVVHGAALTSGPEALGMSRAAHVCANIGMTARALEAARGAGAARVLFLSSMGVFAPDDGPVRDGRTTEAALPSAGCPYAAAKRAGELIVAAAAEVGFEALSLRIGNVFGPHERARPSRQHLCLAARMRAEAAAGAITPPAPGAPREWAWLPDLADGIAALMAAPWAAPLLHAGTPPVCTDGALAGMIAARTGARVAAPPGPAPALRPPMGSAHAGPMAKIAWTPIESALNRLMPATVLP